MSQEDVEIVLDQFAAVNERDFSRAMSHYADDVELVIHPEAFLEHGTRSGREEVGRWFGNWFATFEPGYRFEISEAREVADLVLLIAEHHGRGRSSGAEVHGETGYLYTVREGRVVRAELFASGADALSAAESRQPGPGRTSEGSGR